MGPEFFHVPRVLSGAYDQYALAISVYEMICGSRPFLGDSAQLIVAHVTRPVPEMSQFRPDIPATLSHAVNRALAKKAADRFATCVEFARSALEGTAPASSRLRMALPTCSLK